MAKRNNFRVTRTNQASKPPSKREDLNVREQRAIVKLALKERHKEYCSNMAKSAKMSREDVAHSLKQLVAEALKQCLAFGVRSGDDSFRDAVHLMRLLHDIDILLAPTAEHDVRGSVIGQIAKLGLFRMQRDLDHFAPGFPPLPDAPSRN